MNATNLTRERTERQARDAGLTVAELKARRDKFDVESEQPVPCSYCGRWHLADEECPPPARQDYGRDE